MPICAKNQTIKYKTMLASKNMMTQKMEDIMGRMKSMRAIRIMVEPIG